jgi:hypothetical protein
LGDGVTGWHAETCHEGGDRGHENHVIFLIKHDQHRVRAHDHQRVDHRKRKLLGKHADAATGL